MRYLTSTLAAVVAPRWDLVAGLFWAAVYFDAMSVTLALVPTALATLGVSTDALRTFLTTKATLGALEGLYQAQDKRQEGENG